MATNTITLPVPLSGDGTAVDVSELVGPKTVVITGDLVGEFVLLVGHTTSTMVPAMSLNPNGGTELTNTPPLAYKYAAVRVQDNLVPPSGVTVALTGVSSAGENSFGTVAAVSAGAFGPQAAVDTHVICPTTGFETEQDLICEGLFEGDIIVEGSPDGTSWNAVAKFEGGPVNQAPTVQILEFAPLPVTDKTRYLRAVVTGKIVDVTRVTIGGRVPAAGGGGSPTGPAGGELTGTYPNPSLSTPAVQSKALAVCDPAGAAATVQGNLAAHEVLTTTAHGGLVPPTRTVNGQPLSGDVTLGAPDVGADPAGSAATVQGNLAAHEVLTTTAHGGLIPAAAAGVPGGVATLGGDGLVPTSQLPANPNLLLPQGGASQYPGLWTFNTAWTRDSPTLAAGAVYTLLDVDGAGYVSYLSMTFNSLDAAARESSSVQIYVDGEVTPSVDLTFKDLCCARGASGNFLNTNFLSDKFGTQATAFGVGTSFYFRFMNAGLPYSSHIKVTITNGSATTSALLGGYVEYHSGTTMNWGKYGKLRAQVIPAVSIPAYNSADLLDVTLPQGGCLAAVYIHCVGGDGNYNYQEGVIYAIVNGGARVVKFDSWEDFVSQGFFFFAGLTNTPDLGCTYKDGVATVGFYRFFTRDPIDFSSRLQLQFVAGYPIPNPMVNPVTVRGVIWYYEATDVPASSLTTIKGDPGTPGTTPPGFHNGSGVPSAGLGNNGDTYLDVVSGNIYTKSAGSWSLQLNIIGPSGYAFSTQYLGDLTALGAQTITGDGAVTIDGIGAVAANHANSSQFAVVPGTGLLIQNSAANTSNDGANLTGPAIYWPLVNFSSALNMQNWNELWIMFKYNTPHVPNANYEIVSLGVCTVPSSYAAANLLRMVVNKGYNGALRIGQFQTVYAGGASAFRNGFITGVPYDVVALRIQPNMISGFYGLTVGGNFPPISDLSLCGRAGIAGAAMPQFDTWAAWVGVMSGNTAAAVNLALEKVWVFSR